ncbi:MAG: triose-phosphate isomerase [bacterium]|nr:triose-phosphate isomerase [bacterium]
MKKLIIANWKDNPATAKEAEELFYFYYDAYSELRDKIDLVVCPPAVYIQELAAISKSMPLGAQDVSWESSVGPHTGEITADVLKNLGVEYVLVGHSERRYGIGESDEVISKKLKAALSAGLTPVLIVGERNNQDDRKKIIEEQLAIDLDALDPESVSKIILAYEPVWAISTSQDGHPDTPQNAFDALGEIKNFVFETYRVRPDAYRSVYGGSITEGNVAAFLGHDEINGALIGGASLRKEEFSSILKIVSELK